MPNNKHPATVVATLTINVMADGGLQVNGIPGSLELAQLWLHQANNTIALHFLNRAMDGEVDRNGNVRKKGILIKDPRLVAPDGTKFN